MSKAIVLASGGIDSSTILKMVIDEGYETYVISFNYKQRHILELKRLSQFIKPLNVKEHKVIDVDLRAFGGSSLTDDIAVTNYKNKEDISNDVPNSYVPARNTIFLSYALAYAEVTNANNIFIGAHLDDKDNYPDCREEYLSAYEHMANLATAKNNNIKINAPFINKTKAEIIATGLKHNVDYALTSSCYNPSDQDLACGKCLSCQVRMASFESNKLEDPINYKTYPVH